MDASASRISSVHSASVNMLSMTAAKELAKAGIGGLVVVKSMMWAEAFGGASGGRNVSISKFNVCNIMISSCKVVEIA